MGECVAKEEDIIPKCGYCQGLFWPHKKCPATGTWCVKEEDMHKTPGPEKVKMAPDYIRELVS